MDASVRLARDLQPGVGELIDGPLDASLESARGAEGGAGTRPIAERLGDAKDVLKTYVDAIADCLQFLDEDGHVVRSFVGRCSHLTSCVADHVGKRRWDVGPEAVRPRWRTAFAEAKAGGVGSFVAAV